MSDPFSANTVLLLHMNGSGGSTVFTDSSGLPKPVTAYGNASISTSQSKWGNGSGYFDGNGDYLLVPSASDLEFGTADFTIELWVYYSSLSGTPALLDKRATTSQYSPIVFYTSGTSLTLYLSSNSSSYDMASGTLMGTVSAGAWIHVALSRSGSSIRPFINGVLGATVTSSASIHNNGLEWVFGGTPNGNYLQGYLQDVRITKGIARYTANFTPPTESLPDPDPVTGLIMPNALQADLEDGGGYRIVGTATELGVAGSFRVRLFHRQSGRCIREVWSNPDGSFAFNHLAYRAAGYFAVAFDHTDSPLLNAAIADLITPELMP